MYNSHLHCFLLQGAQQRALKLLHLTICLGNCQLGCCKLSRHGVCLTLRTSMLDALRRGFSLERGVRGLGRCSDAALTFQVQNRLSLQRYAT